MLILKTKPLSIKSRVPQNIENAPIKKPATLRIMINNKILLPVQNPIVNKFYFFNPKKS